MNAAVGCSEHSFAAHLLRSPWCERLPLLERIALIMVNVLTLGIPLLIGCCVLSTPKKPVIPTLFSVGAVTPRPTLYMEQIEGEQPEGSLQISGAQVERIILMLKENFPADDFREAAKRLSDKTSKTPLTACWQRQSETVETSEDTQIQTLGWQADFYEKLLLMKLVAHDAKWEHEGVQILAKQVMLVHLALVLRMKAANQLEKPYAQMAIQKGVTLYQTLIASGADFKPHDQILPHSRASHFQGLLFDGQPLEPARTIYHLICDELSESSWWHLTKGQFSYPKSE